MEWIEMTSLANKFVRYAECIKVYVCTKNAKYMHVAHTEYDFSV